MSDNALTNWRERVGLRRAGTAEQSPILPAPMNLTATVGREQVTLDWAPVEGAIGYLVHRAEAGGRLVPLDHRGGDVLAVPHPPYADTTGEPGRLYQYAIAGLADVDQPGSLGAAIVAASLVDGEAEVRVSVDAGAIARTLPRPWRPIIGSEHLSHLRCSDTSGGRPIGAELADALRIVRDEVGVEAVRAHAILGDDLGVYREVGGAPAYDFAGVDEIYDQVLSLGLRPVVELSFMPHDLARDPSKTVFAYRAIVSPPKDWGRWAGLIGALVTHLIDRYGVDEVRQWRFEVWNEANLDVFWSGTRDEYLRLYDVTARAVRRVDPHLMVGGPASAAVGWVEELLAHVGQTGAPLDFVSTHTYGSPPLDLRPVCARHGRSDAHIVWTEWGATPTHFNPVSDDVFAATFLLRGMLSAAGRVDALAYWVASDHFEELGRPPRLLHGGFGLLTVGNLRKPRFWALALLNRLGDHELTTTLEGDGAASLVQAWASGSADGTIRVMVFNGTLDQSKADGHRPLDRDVRLALRNLSAPTYRLRHWRIDSTHSNVAATWRELGGRDWPDAEQWAVLKARDHLDELEPRRRLSTVDGRLTADFPLPMPGVSYLELSPDT